MDEAIKVRRMNMRITQRTDRIETLLVREEVKYVGPHCLMGFAILAGLSLEMLLQEIQRLATHGRRFLVSDIFYNQFPTILCSEAGI